MPRPWFWPTESQVVPRVGESHFRWAESKTGPDPPLWVLDGQGPPTVVPATLALGHATPGLLGAHREAVPFSDPTRGSDAKPRIL